MDSGLHIIKTIEHWELVRPNFLNTIGELQMIGLDCEWVEPGGFRDKEYRSVYGPGAPPLPRFTDKEREADQLRIENGSAGKVAMLQLGNAGGYTLLIRLCYFQSIPASLKAFLEDPRVAKLGVNIQNDAKKLYLDWDVLLTSFVDLRNIFVRHPRYLDDYDENGMGLKKLNNFLTEFPCDSAKNQTVKFSHWAARELTDEQIEYAKNDAIMAIESMISFATKYVDDLPDMQKEKTEFCKKLRKLMSDHFNRPCSDYVAHFFERNKNGSTNGDKEKAERRRRRHENGWADEGTESDMELDYDHFKKSEDGKKILKQRGASQAAVFKDAQGKPIAALNSAILEALDDRDEPQELHFDIKNQHGIAIFDVGLRLTKEPVDDDDEW